MGKPKENKLERADDLVIVGPVKLSNGFEDQKSSPLSNDETKEETSCGETGGEKTGKLISSLFIKSKNDNTDDRVLQDVPQDATSYANGGKDKKKAVNDPMMQNSPQNVTSFGSKCIGKEKAVEPVVQDTLQDRIASAAATQKRNTPIWFRLVASNQENTIAPLQQVSSSFIRVKNSNMQLSSIKQYLVRKLDLKSENEVELYLENEPLDSSILLLDLWQYWISTKEDVDITKLEVGFSGAEYVMVINYGRKSGHVI